MSAVRKALKVCKLLLDREPQAPAVTLVLKYVRCFYREHPGWTTLADSGVVHFGGFRPGNDFTEQTILIMRDQYRAYLEQFMSEHGLTQAELFDAAAFSLYRQRHWYLYYLEDGQVNVFWQMRFPSDTGVKDTIPFLVFCPRDELQPFNSRSRKKAVTYGAETWAIRSRDYYKSKYARQLKDIDLRVGYYEVEYRPEDMKI